MKSLWKGSISFGLVNVGVRVYSATENHDLDLHMVHAKDGGRIRFQRRCEKCGKVVGYDDIDRAYEDDGRTVVLTDEDLATLPSEQTHEIGVMEFVPAEQVDVLRLDKSYFLEPDKASLKAYTLLRRALADTDRIAITQFTLRRKTRMAAMRVHGDVLVIQTMLWDDEVRAPVFDVLDTTPKISAQEKKMADQLVEALSKDFDEDAFTDEYQDELRKLVAAKLEDEDAVFEDESGDDGSDEHDADVIDLADALRRSVASRSKTPAKKSTSKKPAAKKSTTKKTAAKKAPARRTATKKAAAKKAPARKTAAKKTSSRGRKAS